MTGSITLTLDGRVRIAAHRPPPWAEGNLPMPPASKTTLQDDIRSAIRAEMEPMLAQLQRFVDRRVSELSAEVHANSQLADMTEEKLSRELGHVHEQIIKLVAMPVASTRNSGVELEAVVQATEAAANTIMEAAEAIQDWIMKGNHDPTSIKSLAERVNSIFEACSFQDVTGQRIRRAIQHLQQVETMLEQFLPGDPGAAVEQVVVRTEMRTVGLEAVKTADLAQADIDALMN